MTRLDPARPKRVSLARWVLACTAGELIGFGAAGAVAAFAFGAIPDPTTIPLAVLLILACVAAGVVEGATLGLFQWLAMRRAFPSLRARAWASVTALAGATGWFLGALPATLVSLSGASQSAEANPGWDPGMVATVLVSSILGLVLGGMFGVFQWIVLRKHAANAGRWIFANALGWALALPWSFVAGGSISSASGPALVWGIAALAGVMMGLTVALVTGFFLRRLVARDPSRPSGSSPIRRVADVLDDRGTAWEPHGESV
jgi:MFS family permease